MVSWSARTWADKEEAGAKRAGVHQDTFHVPTTNEAGAAEGRVGGPWVGEPRARGGSGLGIRAAAATLTRGTPSGAIRWCYHAGLTLLLTFRREHGVGARAALAWHRRRLSTTTTSPEGEPQLRHFLQHGLTARLRTTRRLHLLGQRLLERRQRGHRRHYLGLNGRQRGHHLCHLGPEFPQKSMGRCQVTRRGSRGNHRE